jgi:hypothetical protein
VYPKEHSPEKEEIKKKKRKQTKAKTTKGVRSVLEATVLPEVDH